LVEAGIGPAIPVLVDDQAELFGNIGFRQRDGQVAVTRRVGRIGVGREQLDSTGRVRADVPKDRERVVRVNCNGPRSLCERPRCPG
jgi:hypothetical protein